MKENKRNNMNNNKMITSHLFIDNKKYESKSNNKRIKDEPVQLHDYNYIANV